MKLIIAGSREIKLTNDQIMDYIRENIGFLPDEIICGMARGVDLAGKAFGDNLGIPVIPFKPEYEKYGRYRAPRLRNSKMAVAGTHLLLIWDGKSGGSRHMKEAMTALNKPIYEVIVESKKDET